MFSVSISRATKSKCRMPNKARGLFHCLLYIYSRLQFEYFKHCYVYLFLMFINDLRCSCPPHSRNRTSPRINEEITQITVPEKHWKCVKREVVTELFTPEGEFNDRE